MGLFGNRETGRRIEPKSGINIPGVRENGDGTATIQMAKRSDQLTSIADTIESLTPNHGKEAVTLTAQQARQLWGMAQTIGRVAEELKSIGR